MILLLLSISFNYLCTIYSTELFMSIYHLTFISKRSKRLELWFFALMSKQLYYRNVSIIFIELKDPMIFINRRNRYNNQQRPTPYR